ncbi:MAG: hypothetical protein LUE08_02820 [Akkermansiaceae bacterium]|nr:hypothetical protein [Akkermansiaceae bacterium]
MICCQLSAVSASAGTLNIAAYSQTDKSEKRSLETVNRLIIQEEGRSCDEERQIVREGCELVEGIAAQESAPEVVYEVAERLYDGKYESRSMARYCLMHAGVSLSDWEN